MCAKAKTPDIEEIKTVLLQMGEKARMVSRRLAVMSSHDKNRCLTAMAEALEKEAPAILKANAKDIKAAVAKGLAPAMVDRLKLDETRLKKIAAAVRELCALEDPVGKILSVVIRPNGLKIEKVSVPIGVIGIIYEARPNVTVDAASLCLKAGNAVILRGGSEAFHSNTALVHCINRAAVSSGLPDGAIQLIPWTEREAVNVMLKMNQFIDLIMPRGGESLIRAVVEQSNIPVIKHYKGVCHIYVDESADKKNALAIIKNAKCQRPGVCNALETLLINKKIAAKFAPELAKMLKKESVEMRGDSKFKKLVKEASLASEEDWYEEYLSLILSIKIVDNVEEAVNHINKYGSGHSDSILTADQSNAEYFMNNVDSAAVYVNASTRFTDGGEFGMGAEIGISTDKLHARGPMGLVELTSYKYKVYGNGQIRS